MEMRQHALERSRLPDELDAMLTVAPSKASLALVALGLVIAGLVLWGFFGQLPREVSASGVLTAGGFARVESTAQGQVANVMIRDGESVKAGEAVIVLGSGSGRVLRTPFSGTIENVDTAPGQVAQIGTLLYTLQLPPAPGATLTALLFFSSSQGATIFRGMSVNLQVASAPAAAFGVVRGTVSAVNPYPVSTAELTSILGSADLAEQFSRGGPPLVVQVHLTTDRRTRSGLHWSTPQGPPFPIAAGASVSGAVIEEQQTPIKVVFGI